MPRHPEARSETDTGGKRRTSARSDDERGDRRASDTPKAHHRGKGKGIVTAFRIATNGKRKRRGGYRSSAGPDSRSSTSSGSPPRFTSTESEDVPTISQQREANGKRVATRLPRRKTERSRRKGTTSEKGMTDRLRRRHRDRSSAASCPTISMQSTASEPRRRSMASRRSYRPTSPSSSRSSSSSSWSSSSSSSSSSRGGLKLPAGDIDSDFSGDDYRADLNPHTDVDSDWSCFGSDDGFMDTDDCGGGGFDDRYDSDGNTITSGARRAKAERRRARAMGKGRGRTRGGGRGASGSRYGRDDSDRDSSPCRCAECRRRRHTLRASGRPRVAEKETLPSLPPRPRRKAVPKAEMEYDPRGTNNRIAMENEVWFAAYLAITEEMAIWCYRHSDRTPRVWNHVSAAAAFMGVGLLARRSLTEWARDYRYVDDDLAVAVSRMSAIDARVVQWGGSLRFPPERASFWTDLVRECESIARGVQRHIALRRELYSIYAAKDVAIPSDAREWIARAIRLLDCTINEAKPNVRAFWKVAHPPRIDRGARGVSGGA